MVFIKAEEFNQSAFNFNKSVHPMLMSICEPLLSKMNIRHFRYMKMFNDYRYFSLGTNLTYLEHYLKNLKEPGKIFEPVKIYSTPLLIPQEKNFHYFLWPNTYRKTEKDPLFNILYEFDVWNGFTVSRRGPDYVETWSFATTKNAIEMTQFYLNNTHILDYFILYFENKAEILLKDMEKDKLAIFQSPFNLSFSLPNSPKPNILNEEDVVKIFIKNKDVHLTKRELECLLYVSMGMSHKQIAKVLGISFRTVEAHINSLRAKTGIFHKFELASLMAPEGLIFLKYLVENQKKNIL